MVCSNDGNGVQWWWLWCAVMVVMVCSNDGNDVQW